MRIAVFASGGGSNFQAIVDASNTGLQGLDVVLCVTNRPDAGVLVRAESAGIKTLVISSGSFDSPADFAEALLAELKTHRVDLIALAGYLKKVPLKLVRAFPQKILNIHPALLPEFGGKGMYGHHVHEAVIESGASHSGATVHFVDEDYDTGRILIQREVRVHPDDTPDTLAARVLSIEHQLYPEALQLVLSGDLLT
jgi:phosphoribosylglycinamide formyltransferase 1